jgi:hypothetical protein
MNWLKAAVLTTALAWAGTAAAQSAYQPQANQPRVNPGYPPQVATNPGLPYSNAPQPGPTVGYGASVQPPTAAGASASAGIRSEHGDFYSRKGFGPAPN